MIGMCWRVGSIFKGIYIIKTKEAKFLYMLFVSICFFLVSCSSVKNKNTFLKPWESHRLPKTEMHKPLYKSKAHMGNPDPYYQLACYYQRRGMDKKAIKEFEKAIFIDPNYVEVYNKMGISYDRMKNFSKAVISYQSAIALNPELYHIYNNLGFSYMLQGHYDEAIHMLKKAIALNKGNARIHNNLGMVYAKKEQFDKAMEEFRLAENEAWAYYQIACIYYEKGMFDEAKSYYAKALELNPSYATSQKGLEMPQIFADISKDMLKKREVKEMSKPIELREGYIGKPETRPKNGKFGCIAPLSGPLSDYGEKIVRGIKMAIDEYNQQHGASVDVVLFDSMGIPEKAQKGVEFLAYQEKVAAIIGPLLTSTTMASASIAEQIGIPLFTPTASGKGLPETGNFIFRNCLTNYDQVEALANYAVKEMGLLRFGIFSPFNPYGQDMMNLFADQIETLGGSIEIMEYYDQEATDFREQILKINRVKPEALFLPDFYEKITLIASQIQFYRPEEDEEEEEREEGPIQLLGSNLWFDEKVIEEDGVYVDGAIVSIDFYPESNNPRARLFCSNFQNRYGESPKLVSALSYDVTNMLLQASYGEDTSWDMIRDRLYQIQNFPGVSGKTTILPSGESKKEVTLVQIQDRSFVPIKISHFN
jgi:branched-chain amino acid transport system substrate-binding protein